MPVQKNRGEKANGSKWEVAFTVVYRKLRRHICKSCVCFGHGEENGKEVNQISASIENHLIHPLAKAIVSHDIKSKCTWLKQKGLKIWY